jgi:hypothetical protein
VPRPCQNVQEPAVTSGRPWAAGVGLRAGQRKDQSLTGHQHVSRFASRIRAASAGGPFTGSHTVLQDRGPQGSACSADRALKVRGLFDTLPGNLGPASGSSRSAAKCCSHNALRRAQPAAIARPGSAKTFSDRAASYGSAVAPVRKNPRCQLTSLACWIIRPQPTWSTSCRSCAARPSTVIVNCAYCQHGMARSIPH